MSTLLNVLVHVLLIGSMLAFVAVSVMMTVDTTETAERWIRIAALFAGAMIVVGAQAAGVTFSQFIVDALASNGPGSSTVKLAAAAVPGTVGLGVGWYLTNSARRHTVVALRVMVLIGMLAAVQFAEIYAAALHRNGFDLGATAIPNLAFAVGVILWLVLNYGVRPRSVRPRVTPVRERPGPPRPADGDATTFLFPPAP